MKYRAFHTPCAFSPGTPTISRYAGRSISPPPGMPDPAPTPRIALATVAQLIRGAVGVGWDARAVLVPSDRSTDREGAGSELLVCNGALPPPCAPSGGLG